ncbi:MAG: zinc metalloprotease HtpX [Candidatus Aenigmarchaeota archaeon]|nr:zinc metalloprotease HtpX [Candidatus Aenigmarchaeota archaeon]
MMAILRTALLLGTLTAIFLLVGYIFAGIAGATIALVLALLLNFVSYWYSDSFVLKLYKAKKYENKKIQAIIEKIAKKAEIPVPPLYIVDMKVPNAFATGRSPKHSAVAVTKGLMDTLTDEEIEGVLAHEMSHIKNRDTLVSTMAATIAGAISWLAYAFYFSNNEEKSPLSFVFLFILAPFAAMLIQLAVSRSREYGADKTGAMMADPLKLADALEKISASAKSMPIAGNSSTAHLFIINPFRAGALTGLFSTHPSTESRVKILRAMKK